MVNPRNFKTKTILIVTFLPAILIAIVSIGLSKLDPMYGTDQYLEAEIVSQTSMVGKSGSKVEVIVKASDGRIYRFNKTAFSEKGIGDRVTLRLYERKITGLQKYKLERKNAYQSSEDSARDLGKLLEAGKGKYDYLLKVK